ncbi:hypothetical protein J4Q44_G00028400 [Coregonus suidteri]|uniref:Uncharacterized protein n=1 Tax=Coregonus suidteri TaxID=861788 RepID=A0AAN8M9B0_9TELE
MTDRRHYDAWRLLSFFLFLFYVVVCEQGKMIPAEFEKQVQRAKYEGALPFMVNATAGTTVLGAFDPLEEIADICERHNLWMHVDVSGS